MEEEVERFFATLRGALGELQSAYASILEDIRNLLTDAFELGGGDAQHLLSSRARRLLDLAGEPELKAFLMRAADATLKILREVPRHFRARRPVQCASLHGRLDETDLRGQVCRAVAGYQPARGRVRRLVPLQ